MHSISSKQYNRDIDWDQDANFGSLLKGELNLELEFLRCLTPETLFRSHVWHIYSKSHEGAVFSLRFCPCLAGDLLHAMIKIFPLSSFLNSFW